MQDQQKKIQEEIEEKFKELELKEAEQDKNFAERNRELNIKENEIKHHFNAEAESHAKAKKELDERSKELDLKEKKVLDMEAAIVSTTNSRRSKKGEGKVEKQHGKLGKVSIVLPISRKTNSKNTDNESTVEKSSQMSVSQHTVKTAVSLCESKLKEVAQQKKH